MADEPFYLTAESTAPMPAGQVFDTIATAVREALTDAEACPDPVRRGHEQFGMGVVRLRLARGLATLGFSRDQFLAATDVRVTGDRPADTSRSAGGV